jgi:D-alanyl-D-alanine carboxypeptidase/D-alanyl-D-alanine-endopeptidase (penicillin-binding protein 4)
MNNRVYSYTMRLIFLSLVLVLGIPFASLGQNSLHLPSLVKNGSVRVELQDGSPLVQYRDTESFVPASVLKLATAFCTIEQLGTDFRFETIFFSDNLNTLFIQGSGDPSLVSETLESIAQNLSKAMKRVDRIVIDTSLFADDLQIDGSERSLNPYDAKNAAFVGNYASAVLTHSRKGVVVSAEPQTPLTAIARQAALRLPRGTTERVNLSTDWRIGVRYGGELLAAFLAKHGVEGSMSVSLGATPATAKVILRHRSPLTLGEIVKSMLEYSTNFTANQLFLVLGATKHKAPATVQKGQQVMSTCLEQRLGWRDFHIEEGSGLSRKNRVSSLQMTELLKSFERYSFLMPTKNGFVAKTGTLRGVSSLAGYIDLGERFGTARFCIIINAEVPGTYKFHVARELREYLSTH